MTDAKGTEPLPAGDFAVWLAGLDAAIRGDTDSDVPCDGCTACCTASQFVHIAPSETDTLARIPRQLLFPAPGAPAGHVLLGYDERGHCPMLIDNRCSIYEDRPRTCRTYDCRVFPATGVDVDKPGVAARTDRWRFTHPTVLDQVRHDACVAAANYLREHRGELPDGAVPGNPTQLAVLAVEVHDAFRGGDAAVDPDPGVEAVSVAILRRRRTPE